ncbi:IS3 family transposase [Floccifex sp.]
MEYYNTKRINLKRKGLSPLAYRQKSLSYLK